jgi:hypothetical protein
MTLRFFLTLIVHYFMLVGNLALEQICMNSHSIKCENKEETIKRSRVLGERWAVKIEHCFE